MGIPVRLDPHDDMVGGNIKSWSSVEVMFIVCDHEKCLEYFVSKREEMSRKVYQLIYVVEYMVIM